MTSLRKHTSLICLICTCLVLVRFVEMLAQDCPIIVAEHEDLAPFERVCTILIQAKCISALKAAAVNLKVATAICAAASSDFFKFKFKFQTAATSSSNRVNLVLLSPKLNFLLRSSKFGLLE